MKKQKQIKVMVIDPFVMDVYEATIDNSLEGIYQCIGNGCQLFEAVNIDYFTSCYVDEEGTFGGHAEDAANKKRGFLLKNRNSYLFGRGLIVGITPYGDTTSTNLTKDGVINMLEAWIVS